MENKQPMQSYQALAMRTRSEHFDAYGYEAYLLQLRTSLEPWGRLADKLKRTIYYNLPELPKQVTANEDNGVPTFRPEHADLLHAALGFLSESHEFFEGLFNPNLRAVNKLNLVEELGDILWYVALACTALGTTIEKVQEGSIAKLARRYPDKFTQGNAAVRNTAEEMKALADALLDSSGMHSREVAATVEPLPMNAWEESVDKKLKQLERQLLANGQCFNDGMNALRAEIGNVADKASNKIDYRLAQYVARVGALEERLDEMEAALRKRPHTMTGFGVME